MQWLSKGDGNTQYFHNALKERTTGNRIVSMYTYEDLFITNLDVLVKLIRNFYINLLGKRAGELQGLDLRVMRQEPIVNQSDSQSLIVPITSVEMDKALWSINVDKVQGIDGLKTLFYKKAWTVVKHDMYKACLYFFSICIFIRKINYTVVTLI